MDQPEPHAPCPCGSGTPYGRCCQVPFTAGHLHPPGAAEELERALAAHSFDTLRDVQAFAEAYMAEHNRSPQEVFHGLSPEQVHRLVYFPFDSPDLIRINEAPQQVAAAPVLILFGVLVEAMGDKGLKPTAKGNLPRAVCREAARRWLGEEKYAELTRFGNINREQEFEPVHVTRVVAELAGLIRKYRGRFIPSRECRRLLDGGGLAAVYPPLFRTHVAKFNWAYSDHYPDLPFIQQAWAFTLYLLARHGHAWRLEEFYSGHFLHAFPVLAEEAPARPYATPEKQVRHAHSMRTLHRFAGFMGLVEEEHVGSGPFSAHTRLRATPLLRKLVHFPVLD